MKLPDHQKVIGLIIYDENEGGGDIFWDDWWFSQNKGITSKDAMNDVAGLADRKYQSTLGD